MLHCISNHLLLFFVFQDSVYPSLQFAVFGCVSFLTGIMCLKLPETLNKPLPETMNDLNATSKPQDGSDIVYKELKEDVL